MTIQQISISKARANISNLINQIVHNEKAFEITKDGVGIAYIVGKNHMKNIVKDNEKTIKAALVKEAKALRAKSKKLKGSTADLLRESRELRNTLYD
ncbi:type II toxin-antitoxin system prevent-host-death family antitoxin [Candidatus Roizmanbacteria bacterium]|nr:type II toxin-antitoxin system prevent-host-death family antitoxin [Candidatus Roizmanbacteria bacterium]